MVNIIKEKSMIQIQEIKNMLNIVRITTFIKEKQKILVLILLVVFVATAYTLYAKYQEANPDVQYSTRHIEQRDLVKTITVDGEVMPESEAELAPDTSGQITELYVHVGQQVQKGAIVAKVENSTQQAQVTQTLGALQAAKAQVESSKVSLTKIENGTREEQLRILESELQSSKDDYQSTLQSARNVLSNAYAVTNQAVIHGTDALFKNALRYNPKIDFTVSDSELRDKLSAVRVDIRYILDRHEDVQVQTISPQEAQSELALLLSELQIINNFYADIFTAIEEAVISDEVEAKYVSIVTPARNTVLGQMSAVTAMSNTLTQKQNRINIAQASLDQAVTGAIQEDIDVAKVGISTAEATALSAGGTYQAAKAALSKTLIRSPISGVIVDIYKEVGEFVSGASPLLKVSSQEKYVSALVAEVDIAKIQIGMEVILQLDAFKDTELSGTIDFVYPDKQEVMNIVYYEVKISFSDKNPDDIIILPGMSLDVVIPYEHAGGVSALKRGLARKKSGEYFVTVINKDRNGIFDSKFIEAPFTHGFVGDDYVEVVSGLDGQVIVEIKED